VKIAEVLAAREGAKVEVRIPSDLQEKLGKTARGAFMRMERHEGSRIVRARVKIKGDEYTFRPQDLSLV